MSEPFEATDENWEAQVLESELPVLVDFWAEWCGPCKMIAPSVHEMAEEFDGKLMVGKVDVDNAPNIAMKYGIRSIPALIFFKGGQPVDQIVGAVPKGVLKSKIEAVLEASTAQRPIGGVEGARWLLRTSNPLCLVTSGVGGFDSLALPPSLFRFAIA